MNVTGFLQCLSGNNFQSGNLVAFYDFTQKNSSLVFNLKYPTGQAYSGIYVNTATSPGLFVGTNQSIGGQVSTQIGNSLNLTNIHCLFDFDFSGCQNTGKSEATVLLTSKSGYSDPSGFIFGVNSSNRLFFENEGEVFTFNQELRNKNVINLSIAKNNFINFGVYDFFNDIYTGKSINSSLNKPTSDLYLINFPSGGHTIYSGAMGSLRNFALLDDSISQKDILTSCLFCTGTNNGATTTSGTLITISGVTGQNIYESGVTGYQTGVITILKEDGSRFSGVYTSGISGLSIIDTQIVPILSSGSAVSFTAYYPVLQYNSGEKLSYVSGNAIFGQNLSGYIYEAYFYKTNQLYKNIRVLDYALPTVDGLNLNLFINGLLETENVDFSLLGNEVEILGDAGNSDILVASYSVNPTTTINYVSQFSLNAGNEVCITGSGFYSGYDVYLNGKKLIKNYEFYTGTYSANPAVIFYSGNLVSGSEIKFYPIDDIPVSKTGQLATNTYGISGITGYSEQIWLNGVFQTETVDYFLTQPCFENYYFLSSTSDLLIYNNDDYYLNI